MKKWLACLFVSLGFLLAVSGIVLVVMYVWAAIIVRSGKPDQSLLFWYLPSLFPGLISGAGGVKLLLHGVNQTRGMRNESR